MSGRERGGAGLSHRAGLLGWTLALVLAVPGAAAASDQLWALLKGGGQVILIRHAITTPGVGDPPGMRLDDCSTQRNLTDEGRRDARRLGEAFRARGIPVGRVLSSPWCRCLETARLAFESRPKPGRPSATSTAARTKAQTRCARCEWSATTARART